jgi:hypothetical protein
MSHLFLKVENFANFVASSSPNFVGPSVDIDGQPFNLQIWKYDANLKAPSATSPAKYLGVFLFRSLKGELADALWDRWVEVRFHIKSSQDSSADIVISKKQRKLTKESPFALFRFITTIVITILSIYYYSNY